MRRAQQCRYFGTQSAAELTSLAPHDSKARLRAVTTRRRFMAKPCTPHPHCAARAVLQASRPRNVGGRGGLPSSVLLGGVKGAILSREREWPPYCAPPAQSGRNEYAAPSGCQNLRTSAPKREHPCGCSLLHSPKSRTDHSPSGAGPCRSHINFPFASV